MNVYIFLNDNHSCFKKWCEKENYNLSQNSIWYANRDIYFDEIFEENSWSEYGLLLNHEIHMEIPDYPSQNCLESLNAFISFVKYVCVKTDSDMLVF